MDPRFATARAFCSSFSSAIFCASITSAMGRFPSGPKHHAAERAPLRRARQYSWLAGTADAITFAAMAASYFEMPIIFVLGELRWG